MLQRENIGLPAPKVSSIVAIATIVIGAVLGYATVYIGQPALIGAGIFAMFIAVASVLNAEVGLLMLIVITYTRLSDVLIRSYGFPSIAKPFIALLLLGILLRWFYTHTNPKGWMQSAVLVGAYGMVVFVSLFYAADFQRAWVALDDFVKDGMIAVLVVFLLQTGPTFRRVIWALLAVGLFLGTLSVYQYFTGTFDNDYFGFAQAPVRQIVGDQSSSRLGGPIGDPNFYAQIMLVLIPLAINRTIGEKNFLLKALAGWILAACILTVVFTYSRGAFLALIVMVVIGFIYRPPRLAEMLLGLVLLIALARFVPNPYFDRLATIEDVFGSEAQLRGEASFRGRASEALAGWLMFRDHPILGVGVQNYPVFYQYYSRQLGLDPRLEARSAHNLYIQIAAETGLLGILVFGTIVWFMFRDMYRAWRRLDQMGQSDYADMVLSFAVGVVGYMTASLFIHGAYPRYFWLLAGIALAIPHVADHIISSAREGGRLQNVREFR